MPYHVGKKGSYGCSGYPAVKDDGTVMGCHNTAEEAANQIYAINQSEGNIGKSMYSIRENVPGCSGYAVVDEDGELDACFATRAEAEAYVRAENEDEMSEDTSDLETNDSNMIVSKQSVTEGDYVMAMTTEGMVVGQVEHVMREGGRYGEPENPYSVNSTPDNPAVAIRLLEEEDGMYYYTPYSIGALMSNVARIDKPNISTEDYEDDEDMQMSADEEERYGRRHNEMHKAETFTPNAGMRAAARRALKWKEEGKATGAGTAVGWGRATDIAAGRSMSLSVVRRMFSFFSRHEQASKGGKDFNNTSNPSNGRIMWDAWGGNAGFSWSRSIVNRMKDKALFADFGKDYTRAERLTVKALGVGSMVSWNSSGGRAEGKITRIIRNGSYNVPGTEVTINGTPENPAAVIRLYRDGKPTDVIVAHRMSTLRGK